MSVQARDGADRQALLAVVRAALTVFDASAARRGRRR